MPVFAFQRRSDIERETGFDLAGQLIVDIPKGREFKNKRNKKLLQEIIRELQQMAAADRMPPDALLFGWANGRKPDDAADTSDDALMTAWAKRSINIVLRLGDPLGDGSILIDNEAMRWAIGMN
jgi:hypothetical protein